MNSCFLNTFSKFGKVRNINDLLYFFEYNSIEVIDEENLNYRQLFTEESQDYNEMAQLNLIEQSLNNINSKFFDPRKSVSRKIKMIPIIIISLNSISLTF
jgi:hypothetical protein